MNAPRLNRPSERDAPDDVSALDDLLETSDRLYHRLVAQEQVRLQHWIEVEQEQVEMVRERVLKTLNVHAGDAR